MSWLEIIGVAFLAYCYVDAVSPPLAQRRKHVLEESNKRD